jgi:hypothetical protein
MHWPQAMMQLVALVVVAVLGVSFGQYLGERSAAQVAVRQQAVCMALALAASGRAPLPVKSGYEIDQVALRQYLAQQCAIVL